MIALFGLPDPWSTVALVAAIAIGLPLLIYLLLPLLILGTSWYNADAVPAVIDPDARLPEGAQALDDRMEDLGRLGFEPVAACRIAGFVPNVLLEITVMANRSLHTAAAAMAAYVSINNMPPRLKQTFIEFSTELRDGSHVNTNDSPAVIESVPRADRRILHAGPGWTASQHLDIHRARLRQFASPPKPLESDDAIIDWVERLLAKDVAYWESRGLVRKAPAPGITHRPTLKGAYVMTWRCIPPRSTKRMKRDRAIARRLARS